MTLITYKVVFARGIGRSLDFVALMLTLGVLLCPGVSSGNPSNEVDPAFGDTAVTPLYRLLARINGEPLPALVGDQGIQLFGTDPGHDLTDRDTRPAICFPRGVSAFTPETWRAAPVRYQLARHAVDELALRLRQTREASALGSTRPTVSVRIIGYADPTAERAGTHDNMELSLDRARSIAKAIGARVGPGFNFAVEGRGEFHPRPNDPGDDGKSLVADRNLSESDDTSCAPMQAAIAAHATIDPAKLRYVASQRRVEIEVATPTLTHVGHRLTMAPDINSIKNDVRLRLFPENTMPARALTHEVAFIPQTDFSTLAECKPGIVEVPNPGGAETIALRRPLSSGWLRLTKAMNSVGDEVAWSDLDKADGRFTMRLDVYPTWLRRNLTTVRGVRVELTLARQAVFIPPEEQDGTRAKMPEPPVFGRGMGVPGFWAVHQRFEHLFALALGPDGSQTRKCLSELLERLPAKSTDPNPLREALGNPKSLRDVVVKRLPKDLDGLLLQAHRLDRQFRFFDLRPGMTLHFRPTQVDARGYWLQPSGPADLTFRPDPIDPCARVPVPRRYRAPPPDVLLSRPTDVMTDDPFSALMHASPCPAVPGEADLQTIKWPSCSEQPSQPGQNTIWSCTRHFEPLQTFSAIDRIIGLGHTRVFVRKEPPTLIQRDKQEVGDDVCPQRRPEAGGSGEQTCPVGWWRESADRHSQATILVASPTPEQLDSRISARDFRAASIDFPPCIDNMKCGYLMGGMTFSPSVMANIGGSPQRVMLGTRLAHVLPGSVTGHCFGPVEPQQRWRPNAKLTTSHLRIELGGAGVEAADWSRALIVDRTDCRLLGLFLTEGSTVAW